MREKISLGERKLDLVIVGFFLLNLVFVSFLIAIEPLVISDPYNFQQPVWPPALVVDLIHAYGDRYDPLVMARPLWWKVLIAWDVCVFAPFYAFAVPAYWSGRRWIRLPSIMYASAMLSAMSLVLTEELLGAHAAPQPALALALRAPWVLVPLAILARMLRTEMPFTRIASGAARTEQWSL